MATLVWKTPKIQIGNVPIKLQHFRWSLLSGVIPFQTSFVMPNGPVSEALKAVPNPTTLKIEVTGGTKGVPETVSREIKSIYILEPRAIDPYHTQWTVADVRWGWRGMKIYGSWNKTRIKNQKGLQPVATSDPAVLRQQFDTFKIGRYLPWSVKDAVDPYNMKEICEIVLGELGISFDATVAKDRGAYIVENVELDGVDIYRGFADLLSRSRLNLGIKEDGLVYIYSIDWYDESGVNMLKRTQNTRKTKPGTLYKQDFKRVRPEKINVRFKRLVETRIVGTTSEDKASDKPCPVEPNEPLWTQQDIDNWRVIGCENVIRVPYPVKSPVTGLKYNIGEYIPMWEYLQAVSIDKTDVQNKYFTDLLEKDYVIQRATELGVANTPENEQYARHIISAIRSHYRQVYQIDPWYVDHMASWITRRVAVINNYDRFTPKSPLYADYCVIPARRQKTLANRSDLWENHGYNWLVNTRDPYRTGPTAGTVDATSMPLGIFQVSYPPIIDYAIREIIPFALDPLPYPALSSTAYLMSQCHLKSAHTLETIISVLWHTDKNRDFEGKTKYFHIPVDFSFGNGTGPDIDYLSKLENARFSARELDEAGKVINDGTVPENEGVLAAIAHSESAKLFNQYIDRITGLVVVAGWVVLKINGNIKSITYSFSSAGLETIIDMREIPPAPSIEHAVEQEYIDYLGKHITRGDDMNHLRGENI